MKRLDDDLITYMRGRFDRLDRQAAEIRENTIRVIVAVATQCKEPVYSRVLDRALAGYIEVPADKLGEVIKRIAAEEVNRASRE